jgi:hypothetical protein
MSHVDKNGKKVMLNESVYVAGILATVAVSYRNSSSASLAVQTPHTCMHYYSSHKIRAERKEKKSTKQSR